MLNGFSVGWLWTAEIQKNEESRKKIQIMTQEPPQSANELEMMLKDAANNAILKGDKYFDQSHPDPVREEPEQQKPVYFHAFADGLFAKFCKLPNGNYAICVNTSEGTQPDTMQPVAFARQYAIGDLICSGVNLVLALKLRARAGEEVTDADAIVAPTGEKKP